MADRSRDPEALEKEIERARAELARTIDVLADRVNPRNVAQRGAERLKEEAGLVTRTVKTLVAPGEGGVPAVDRRVLVGAVGLAVTVTAFIAWRRSRR
jgi:hypothetical protein